MFKYALFITSVALFGLGCAGNAPKCTIGLPQAIFSDTIQAIKKHSFELKERTGIELVAFKNGMLLEIEQSGCTEIHQQFSFIMPGDFTQSNDAFWKTLAVKNFQMIASYTPQLSAFLGWASAIEAVNDKLKLAESIEVEKDIFVRIDKVVSPAQSILVVQLFQKKK